jgi:hypothetical protein
MGLDGLKEALYLAMAAAAGTHIITSSETLRAAFIVASRAVQILNRHSERL